MSLTRRYKISNLLNISLSNEDKNIINFIYKKLEDLIPYTHHYYPDSLFFMNNKGEWVLQFTHFFDSDEHIINIRHLDFWDNLEYNYCLKDRDIKTLLHIILKDKFKERINFIGTATINKGYDRDEIERAFKKCFTEIHEFKS